MYQLLGRQVSYDDLGTNYCDERDGAARQKQLIRHLKHLGYEVALQPVPPAA